MKGGVWVFALRITNRGLGFIRTIIIARWLAPEDFGILGVAMLAVTILDIFSQTGFLSALIQKKDDVTGYLDVVWTTLAIRGAILFFLLFLSAPFVSQFFNSAEAELVVKVISINLLLTGFMNIGVIFFHRDLQFNKQFIFEVSATIVDLAISISLALILKNVWALVWGGLAKNFVKFLMSYLLHRYRPRFHFERKKFQELFNFSIWISGSTILVFLITQGDDILVGKLLGISALGFYQMSYLIANLPVTEISDVISRVTFPAYSKIQQELKKLRIGYLKAFQITAFITVPIALGIFALGDQFILIFLGEPWKPAIPVLQILALAGLIGSISATARPLFYAVGRPKIDTIWQIIRLLVFGVIIYPLVVTKGMSGAAIAVLISTFFSTIGFCFMVIKITKCKVWTFMKLVLLPFINALLMVFILKGLRPILKHLGIWQFILLIVIGCLIYIFLTWISEKLFDYKIRQIWMESFGFLQYRESN